MQILRGVGKKNSRLIFNLEERAKNDPNWFEYIDDEANSLREDIRNHITLKIVNDIEDGFIGAVITSDTDADGYYLIKWNGTPYTDHILKNDITFIQKQVHVIELILGMEEFLKHGQFSKGKLKHLEKTVIHFINCINNVCKRGGTGTRLTKNHLYFHDLPKYFEMWGCPANWDSSFSESHHKTRIKAPSKNTHNRMDKLIEQTATRLSELHLIHTATNYYGLSHTNFDQVEKQHTVGGTQF